MSDNTLNQPKTPQQIHSELTHLVRTSDRRNEWVEYEGGVWLKFDMPTIDGVYSAETDGMWFGNVGFGDVVLRPVIVKSGVAFGRIEVKDA